MSKKQKITYIILVPLLIIVSVFSYNFIFHREKFIDTEPVEPVFTKEKLTLDEMNTLVHRFHVNENPKLDEKYDLEKYPELTHYTIEASEDTKLVVETLNYELFDLNDVYNEPARKIASELGLDTINEITVDWVMENPKDAVRIMDAMSMHGDLYNDIVNVRYMFECSGR